MSDAIISTTQETPKPKGEIRVCANTQTGVFQIVIANVARYNAMSLSMWESLARIVQEAEADPAVRVLVLRGEGQKAFVSGADISEFGTLRSTPDQVQRYADAVTAAQQSLVSCQKPVIAAIQGICMGGGIGLALACDLRFCSHGSRFRMPAARMGLGYDRQGLARAVALLGAPATTDIFFTARTFEGTEAERLGMVNACFDEADFEPRMLGIANEIAANAPLTLKAAKLAIRAAINDPLILDPSLVDQAVQACFDSHDYQEGQRAFKEKRAPEFSGR